MTRTGPAKRLMEVSGKCSKEGALYGNCVLQNYQTIGHKTCDAEFIKFKNCMVKNVGKKW